MVNKWLKLKNVVVSTVLISPVILSTCSFAGTISTETVIGLVTNALVKQFAKKFFV